MSTVSQYKNRALTRARNFGEAHLPVVADRLKKAFIGTGGFLKPEDEALKFYLQNHTLSVIESRVAPNQPLGEYQKWFDQYHDDVTDIAVRVMLYLMMAGLRESRHAYKNASYTEFHNKYPDLSEMFKHARGLGTHGAHNALFEMASDTTLRRFVEGVYDAYRIMEYSGSFGGVAWATCMKPLKQVVQGEISMEVFLDMVWTLEHNTGTVFNKPFIYNTPYMATMKKILDVQRSGQIPQYFWGLYSPSMEPSIRDYYASAAKLFPEYQNPVDWKRVEALGSVQKYPTEIAKQEKKEKLASNKVTNTAKIKEIMSKVADFKKVKAAELIQKQKSVAQQKFADEHYEIMPSTFVKLAPRSLNAKEKMENTG